MKYVFVVPSFLIDEVRALSLIPFRFGEAGVRIKDNTRFDHEFSSESPPWYLYNVVQ